MEIHKDDEVNNLNSYFTCHKLFHICIKLDSDLSKLKKNIIYVSKLTISSLENINKNLLEEIVFLRDKKKSFNSKLSFPFFTFLYKLQRIYRVWKLSLLENKIDDLHNKLISSAKRDITWISFYVIKEKPIIMLI